MDHCPSILPWAKCSIAVPKATQLTRTVAICKGTWGIIVLHKNDYEIKKNKGDDKSWLKIFYLPVLELPDPLLVATAIAPGPFFECFHFIVVDLGRPRKYFVINMEHDMNLLTDLDLHCLRA